MQPAPSQSSGWYLEGYVDDSPNRRLIAINAWPFRIGRHPDVSFCLTSSGVSKQHAEIFRREQTLLVRDLESRNGTFVNGTRIARPTALVAGDVLHFADEEFRLGWQETTNAAATMQLARSTWISSLGEFQRLFVPGVVVPYYQPIVRLPGGEVFAYEVLARSSIEALRGPQQMFAAAGRLDMAGRLSELLRREGVRYAQTIGGRPNLFLNMHPGELEEEGFVASLRQLRADHPEQPLTLEIHEAAVTNPKRMRRLRETLSALDVQLAYDDFGAGQARLLDLAEVPPDYLKVDISLVRAIHTGNAGRRQLLGSLVQMAHDLGVSVLAEGIELVEEAQACHELGFDCAQGYCFGRPAPAPNGLPCS